MITNTNIFTIVFCLILGVESNHAATVQINWSTNPANANLVDVNLAPLSNGTNAAGDGTLLQLGYYSLASQSSPFLGSWVTLATSAMGDNGVEIPGQFSVATILTAGSFAAPAVGTPLAVRFFDGASIAGSSYYNSVSVTSGAWNFIAPSDTPPIINMVIQKQSGIVFLGSATSAYIAEVPIPEPTTPLLLTAAGLIACLRRKRMETAANPGLDRIS